MTRRDFLKTLTKKNSSMESKGSIQNNEINDLSMEIDNLSSEIYDLRQSLDSVAGELYALVKVLENKNKSK